jgi:hypothetical protein
MDRERCKGCDRQVGLGGGLWANHQRGVRDSRHALKNSDLVDVVKLYSFLRFLFFIFVKKNEFFEVYRLDKICIRI